MTFDVLSTLGSSRISEIVEKALDLESGNQVLTNSCVSLKSKLQEDSLLIYKVEEDWNRYLITDQPNIPGEATKEKGNFLIACGRRAGGSENDIF